MHRPPGWRKRVVERDANDRYYYTADWQRKRAECLKRDGYRCTRVIDGVRCPNRATIAHHVKERRDGGSDDLSNLASSCVACHGREHPIVR